MTVSILRLWAVNAIFFINAIPGWTQTGKGLDEKINEAFMPAALWWEGLIFTSLAGVPIVLILLLVGALWFTLYFRFANIRYFTTALSIVKGNFDHLERKKPQEDIPDTIRDESHYGEVNHFQALATAISGTVGLGNISMVAVAISIGGPGAAFWMIVAGLLGMSSKLVECTLGVKYREISET
ncbi:MAG: sodium:alanine symporter family protein, partial [Saprospiraceae bacterium]|nr:sodium:alanine symporter family protein [Saprospiraceae bacterium]